MFMADLMFINRFRNIWWTSISQKFKHRYHRKIILFHWLNPNSVEALCMLLVKLCKFLIKTTQYNYAQRKNFHPYLKNRFSCYWNGQKQIYLFITGYPKQNLIHFFIMGYLRNWCVRKVDNIFPTDLKSEQAISLFLIKTPKFEKCFIVLCGWR